MKKIYLTLIFCLTIFFLSAQDYFISFSGTGESNIVSTVFVENLTQNKSLTVNGNDILHLTSAPTGISEFLYNQTEGIQIYPNPMKEFSVLEFSMLEKGFAKIELFDLTGGELTQSRDYLNEGRHSYRISGVGNGVYILKVTSGNYLYSAKLISNSKAGQKADISYQNSMSLNDKSVHLKSAKSEILMQFTAGDMLKFTATGDEHKSVLVDVITQSKNINFPFYKCTDPDGREYATVKIGKQIWMAENLAYLPSISPPSNSSLTAKICYVYDYSGKDVAAAKATINYSTFGVLYNWPAAKALCPTGWHLPSDGDWTALENYLKANGYTYADEYEQYNNGMALAATTNWDRVIGGEYVHKYPALRNKSGFSGLPGGELGEDIYSQPIFVNKGSGTSWWTSDENGTKFACYISLISNLSSLYHGDLLRKYRGFSVRCIKD